MLSVLIGCLFFVLAASDVQALNERFSDNTRWAFEYSSRARIDRNGKQATFLFLGIDLHKIISSSTRDWATLTFQPYLTGISNLSPTPPAFDSPNDWQLIWRVADANIKLLRNGRANLRIGHFELPFGLEETINTNGSPYNFQHQRNFAGVKVDWGASINGLLKGYEYAVAWTLGSGNSLDGSGDVWSGRIGSDRNANIVYGISFLHGTFTTLGRPVKRDRIGLDMQVYWRQFALFSELTTGENNATDATRDLLAEINWRNADETRFLWLRLTANWTEANNRNQNSLDGHVGFNWFLSRRASLTPLFTQGLVSPVSKTRIRFFTFQFRYRY